MPRLLILLSALLIGAACAQRDAKHEFGGRTMGTTYAVVVVDAAGELDRESLQSAVEATLDEVNKRYSNWDPDSEISRFNAQRTTRDVDISEGLRDMLAIADAVGAAADGKFDLTIDPLVELWGFGPPGPGADKPDAAAIAAAMGRVGQKRVIALSDDGRTLRKIAPEASVNLSAIAKGYGIDEVALTLRDMGAKDFMVEIGGDLYASGRNAEGGPWRIGIEKPVPGRRGVEEIVTVADLGMATSGDYRNYVEHDGVRYSHIIDAATGYPVAHRTASATVLAESATLADAWATALLALGAERGLEVAEEQGLAAFFVVRQGNAESLEFTHILSSRFESLRNRAKE